MATSGANEAFCVFAVGFLIALVLMIGLGIPAVVYASGVGSFILAVLTGAFGAVTLICGVLAVAIIASDS